MCHIADLYKQERANTNFITPNEHNNNNNKAYIYAIARKRSRYTLHGIGLCRNATCVLLYDNAVHSSSTISVNSKDFLRITFPRNYVMSATEYTLK